MPANLRQQVSLVALAVVEDLHGRLRFDVHEVEVEHAALLFHRNVVLGGQRLKLGALDFAAQHQAQGLLAAGVAHVLAQDQADQLRAEHSTFFDFFAVALQADINGLLLRGADQGHAAVDQRHGGIRAHRFGQIEYALIALRQNNIAVGIQQQRGKVDHIQNAGNFDGNSVIQIHNFHLPFCVD